MGWGRAGARQRPGRGETRSEEGERDGSPLCRDAAKAPGMVRRLREEQQHCFCGWRVQRSSGPCSSKTWGDLK